jgi:hypothetical protein
MIVATVDEDRPPETAILASAGHNTTWGRSDLHTHTHTEGKKDPPNKDEQPQADELERSRAIPMAER